MRRTTQSSEQISNLGEVHRRKGSSVSKSDLRIVERECDLR